MSPDATLKTHKISPQLYSHVGHLLKPALYSQRRCRATHFLSRTNYIDIENKSPAPQNSYHPLSLKCQSLTLKCHPKLKHPPSILHLPHSRHHPPRALTHTPLPPCVSHTHYLTASHLKKKAPSTRFISLLTSNERNRRTHTLIVNQKCIPPGQFSRNDPRTKKDYDSCLRQH